MRPYTTKERTRYDHRTVHLTSYEPFHTNDLLNMMITHASNNRPYGQNSTTTPVPTSIVRETPGPDTSATPTAARNYGEALDRLTESENWRTPLEHVAGITPDISAILRSDFGHPSGETRITDQDDGAIGHVRKKQRHHETMPSINDMKTGSRTTPYKDDRR